MSWRLKARIRTERRRRTLLALELETAKLELQVLQANWELERALRPPALIQPPRPPEMPEMSPEELTKLTAGHPMYLLTEQPEPTENDLLLGLRPQRNTPADSES